LRFPPRCGSTRLAHVLVPILLAILLIVPTPARADSVPAAIRAVVALGRLDGLRAPDFTRDHDLVDATYAPEAYAPLWLDRHDEPSAAARDAIAVLQTVDVHGLEPHDYDGGTLADWGHLLEDGKHSATELARFDVALTVAAVRLLSDLHIGRVDPDPLGFHFDIAAKRTELPGLVRDAVVGGRIADGVARAMPPLTERRLLEEALARYRELAADAMLVPPVIAPPVRRGDRLHVAAQLERWLAALGDLAPAAAVASRPRTDRKRVARDPTYDGELVAAVQRFQSRHGLGPDGIIGEDTARALAVPLDVRAKQIALALERLRWLPALPPDRAFVVNVPAFELSMFDDYGSGRPPVMEMSVVVGRADLTQTPFFAAMLTSLTFAPYWRVPPSILRKEILPKLRANPGYLAGEDMEIVSSGQVLAPTPDALARLGHGDTSVRQRPGPKNALGRVKFNFPNPYGIYMHDTPSMRLFRKHRRDFSHGCIRLADAAAVAHWVLEGEGWDSARVDAMLALSRESWVPVRHGISVIVSYTTAVARPDGTLAFYDDLYDHDAELERALAARHQTP
jgi:murein L,D-transpeptidase YcbB/YkuD